MKKIFISGSVMSGKSSLFYLLDGHSKILANVIHDKLINALIDIQLKCIHDVDSLLNKSDRRLEKNIDVISKKNNKKFNMSIYDLRNSLNKANLNHLERYSFLKIYPNFFSRKNWTYLDFNFNFENFQKMWKDQIFNQRNKQILKLENLFEIFYKSFFIAWNDHNNIDINTNFNEKIFVSKLPNNIQSIEFIMEEKFDSKIIYLERDLIGTLKSRTLHYMISRNFDIKNFDKYFYIMAKSTFLDKLIKERKKIRLIQSKYPSQILITSLEKIVNKKREEINKITDFCKINYEEILNFPTYCKLKIGNDHFDKVHDDEQPISKSNNFFVNLRIGNFKYVKIIDFLKFFNKSMIYIFLKIKKKLPFGLKY